MHGLYQQSYLTSLENHTSCIVFNNIWKYNDSYMAGKKTDITEVCSIKLIFSRALCTQHIYVHEKMNIIIQKKMKYQTEDKIQKQKSSKLKCAFKLSGSFRKIKGQTVP